MNITKIASIGVGATLTAGMFVKKLESSYGSGVDRNNPDVSNELNRAWLCSESPNLDKFEKHEAVDLNRQYLCSGC